MRESQPFGGPFTVLAQAAAWSPNAKKPPFYFDLPRDNDQEIAAKWVANSLLRLTEKNISNLKKLRALAFDVGNQDQGIGISVAVLKQLSSQLDSWSVRYTFETYDGTHVSKIPERVEKNVLPFFSTNLFFGTGPTKH